MYNTNLSHSLLHCTPRIYYTLVDVTTFGFSRFFLFCSLFFPLSFVAPPGPNFPFLINTPPFWTGEQADGDCVCSLFFVSIHYLGRGEGDGSVGYKRHMTNEEREERIAGDERLTMIGLF